MIGLETHRVGVRDTGSVQSYELWLSTMVLNLSWTLIAGQEHLSIADKFFPMGSFIRKHHHMCEANDIRGFL
jgi:hypothetical protein